MSDLLSISRNFTELGGFTATEVIDFYKRQILNEGDFVRRDGAEEWLPLHSWLSGVNQTANPIATPDDASSPKPKGGKSKAPAKKGKSTSKVVVPTAPSPHAV
ncbi:MAG: hypothetical protein ACAI34_24385 [Verrucomicrobium sp.]|nr:hypothetical protein [Verrucomicrobium sp.]